MSSFMNLFNLADESTKFLLEKSLLSGNIDSKSLRGCLLIQVCTEKSNSVTK